jgi:hypothetical protein
LLLRILRIHRYPKQIAYYSKFPALVPESLFFYKLMKGVTIMATRRKVRKTRPNYRRPRVCKVARVWTREEISFLRKWYRNHDTSWCARQLGRTVYSVRYKASDLSIRKANPSMWKTPPKQKFYFGTKKVSNRRPSVRRTKKPARWARTRKNNRRTKW